MRLFGSGERASSPLARPPLPDPCGAGLSPGQALAAPHPARGEGLFAEAASRLAGLTGLLLGWRPGVFWAATPAELGAVLGAMAGGEPTGVAADELQRLQALFPD